MKTYIKEYKDFGKTLFAEKGDIVLGIPLEYGLRIGYLAYKDGENLFFEQPKDMTALSTPDGWRVRGGHRLWIAPESKDLYYPDNEPVTYEVLDNKIVISQKNDPWSNLEKTMEISFLEDASMEVLHKVKNTSDEERTFSVWPVTSLDAGGTEVIPLPCVEGVTYPVHRFSTWWYTSLGDKRATYKRDSITLKHEKAELPYKIGIGHPAGPVTYTNKGVVFEKVFEICPDKEYPDGNVSYETYLCNYMVEVESLSPLYKVASGQVAEYKEVWNLRKED